MPVFRNIGFFGMLVENKKYGKMNPIRKHCS